MEYYSKYYKGESQEPEHLNSVGRFFWHYERSFYEGYTSSHEGRFPTKAEFDKWLHELLNEYMPNKMVTGYETPEGIKQKALSFVREYETGQRDRH